MSETYIPLIKKTRWVDLSNEHQRLRETVEKDLKIGCCENGNIQPIMLQGAFGIVNNIILSVSLWLGSLAYAHFLYAFGQDC